MSVGIERVAVPFLTVVGTLNVHTLSRPLIARTAAPLFPGTLQCNNRSMRGVKVQQLQVDAKGGVHDRRWMVIAGSSGR